MDSQITVSLLSRFATNQSSPQKKEKKKKERKESMLWAQNKDGEDQFWGQEAASPSHVTTPEYYVNHIQVWQHTIFSSRSSSLGAVLTAQAVMYID